MAGNISLSMTWRTISARPYSKKEKGAAVTGGEKPAVGAASDADRCPCGGGAPGLPYSRQGLADARYLLVPSAPLSHVLGYHM